MYVFDPPRGSRPPHRFNINIIKLKSRNFLSSFGFFSKFTGVFSFNFRKMSVNVAFKVFFKVIEFCQINKMRFKIPVWRF